MNNKIIGVAIFNYKFQIQLDTLLSYFESDGNIIYRVTYNISYLAKFFDIFISLFSKRKLYSVIHLQLHSYNNFLVLFICLFWKFILRKKLIVMYYGGSAADFFHKWPWLFRVVFKRVDKVIVAGNYMFSVFKFYRLPEPKIIPHILNLNQWDYVERFSKPKKILWVRHLRPEYNPFLAIKVFAQLKETYKELSLDIVGTGSLKDSLVAYINENGIVGINFLDRVSQERLRCLYKEADVFLNTTNVDNQPVTVLEALASGCPVISTDVGGVPDILQHMFNGLLCQKNDIDGMIRNFDLLFSQESLSLQLSKNGRLFILDHFDLYKILNSWAEVYTELGESLAVPFLND